MAGGEAHSLAVKSDGTLWAWGQNDSGQLGVDPTTTPLCSAYPGQVRCSSSPLQVPGLSGVTTVSSRAYHSLALKSDGTVWAWGANDSGQLGNPGAWQSTSSTPVPVCAAGATSCTASQNVLTDVVAVAAGGHHSVALKSDGTVWAWGDDRRGQLGNGRDLQTTEVGTPVQALGLTGVVAVAAGDAHSLALTQDGTVWAWGDNRSDQLGYPSQAAEAYQNVKEYQGAKQNIENLYGSTGLCKQWDPYECQTDPARMFPIVEGQSIVQNSPVPIPVMGGVIGVAAGMHHSLAIRDDETVWAWGDNTRGQLGDGTVNEPQKTPVVVGGNSPLRGVVGVAGGDVHSLALRSDGSVWAWGDATFDQLGSAVSKSQSYSATPVSVPGLANVGSVAAGGVHSLAINGVSPPQIVVAGEASPLHVDASSVPGAVPPGTNPCGVMYQGPDKVSMNGGCQSGAVGVSGLPLSGGVATMVRADGQGNVTSDSSVGSISLALGSLPPGPPLISATGLRASTSTSCRVGGVSSIRQSSSIAKLTVAGITVATQPVGSQMVFNPLGGRPGSVGYMRLYGSPIWVNPLGGRIPMAIVTLNYSRYDPATKRVISSPAVIDFPPRGPLSQTIVGTVYLSYASTGCAT